MYYIVACNISAASLAPHVNSTQWLQCKLANLPFNAGVLANERCLWSVLW